MAGELASLTTLSGPVPGIAPAAKQMGNYVAGAIQARLQNRFAGPFRYKHYGMLATIGRKAAVAKMRAMRPPGSGGGGQ